MFAESLAPHHGSRMRPGFQPLRHERHLHAREMHDRRLLAHAGTAATADLEAEAGPHLFLRGRALEPQHLEAPLVLARQRLERATRILLRAPRAERVARAQHLRVELDEFGRMAAIAEQPGETLAIAARLAVVDGLPLADLTRLEQQRAELARGLGPFDATRLGRELQRLRVAHARAEVIEHAIAQVVGLADVQQRLAALAFALETLAVEPIDTRRLGQIVRQVGRQLRRQHEARRGEFDRGLQLLARPVGTQLAPQMPEHLGIGHGAMPLLHGDAVVLHDGVEIVPRHLGIQRARQPHGAQVRAAPFTAEPAELAANEPVVESCVVRDEHAARESLAQLLRDALERRRIGDHVVVDARERRDARGNAHAGVHQRLPLEVQAVTRGADHGHVDHAMHAGLTTRGLDVDERDRRIRRDRGGGRCQLSSIHVVLSSVYLSNACRDLSRPMPDCLKPPNGTVMSSAS
jgi:hypothetical protein